MNLVVLTGAGISAESGIRTFRASDGLWENHKIEDVATPEGFARDPERVQNVYNQRRRQLMSAEIQPNAAHFALAKLETYADEFLLVTQNVDNLHERAGSRAIRHMHGELLAMICTECHSQWRQETDVTTKTTCPNCHRQTVRPDIVWFGEIPKYMPEIERALSRCDYFIAIGTSGHVYPAAGFVMLANVSGAKTVELNLQPSATEQLFTEQIYGKATEIVPAFVARLISLS